MNRANTLDLCLSSVVTRKWDFWLSLMCWLMECYRSITQRLLVYSVLLGNGILWYFWSSRIATYARWSSDSHLGTVLLPRGHLAVPGDIFDCQGGGRKRCYWCWVYKAQRGYCAFCDPQDGSCSKALAGLKCLQRPLCSLALFIKVEFSKIQWTTLLVIQMIIQHLTVLQCLYQDRVPLCG